jgi:hypothetical protein
MSNGTDNYKWYMFQAIQNLRACFEAMKFAPAGLSLPVPAHRARSCSTRRITMNLARSIALYAAQKPASPATHKYSELPNG